MVSEKKLNEKTLDAIIDEMTNAVEKSKDEIFHISEEAMEEHAHLLTELEKTKVLVKEYIAKGDKLEKEVMNLSHNLSIVSHEFNRDSDSDIRHVYEQTHSLQKKLAIMRLEETTFREKGDDWERRIMRLRRTIE